MQKWWSIIFFVMVFPFIYLCINRVFHAIVMYITMNVAIMLVFIYAPTEKMQGIVQKIFYCHVSSAITMFFAFFLVCVASIMYLWKNSDWWDAIALSAAEIGVVLGPDAYIDFSTLVNLCSLSYVARRDVRS